MERFVKQTSAEYSFSWIRRTQGMANIENVIQEIAISLKKDALEIRRLNCYSHDERNVTPYGQTSP